MNFRKIVVGLTGLVVLVAVLVEIGEALAQDNARKLSLPSISEDLSIPQKSVAVLGSRMTYLEIGEGDPVVFIHGNPTSSYLWRNIMPYVAKGHRAIALDMIGMGGSDKPDIDYTFRDHYRYFSAFIKALGLKKVTLVGHDWGATLAWEYARRHPMRVTRLAFMEGVLPPSFPVPSFEAMGEDLGNAFRNFKDPVKGKEIVIDNNMFVEQMLPGFVNRTLGEKAMAVYRAPFLSPEDRWPTLMWPRQIPIAGDPPETLDALNGIAEFMAKTKMPVLLLYAEPGVVLPPVAVDWYLARIANLETSFVGQGFHFIQEDQPDAIGREIADWIRRN